MIKRIMAGVALGFAVAMSAAAQPGPAYHVEGSSCNVFFGEPISSDMGLLQLSCRDFSGSGFTDSVQFFVYSFSGIGITVEIDGEESHFIRLADGRLKQFDPDSPELTPFPEEEPGEEPADGQ